jgi:hypothetical protein
MRLEISPLVEYDAMGRLHFCIAFELCGIYCEGYIFLSSCHNNDLGMLLRFNFLLEAKKYHDQYFCLKSAFINHLT